MNQKRRKFDAILFQAVWEGLNNISPSIPSAVLFHLEKDGSIGPDRDIVNPESFDEGLKKIFGFGAKVIEKKILEILYVKFQVPRRVEHNFNFPEEIKNVQKLFRSKRIEVVESHLHTSADK